MIEKKPALTKVSEFHQKQKDFATHMRSLKTRLEGITHFLPAKYKTSQYEEERGNLSELTKITEDLITLIDIGSEEQASREIKLGKAADYLLSPRFKELFNRIGDFIFIQENVSNFIWTMAKDHDSPLILKEQIHPYQEEHMNSLLILPCQMIGRYILLIKDILKEEALPTKLAEAYKQALQVSENAVMVINEKKKLQPIKNAIINMQKISSKELKEKKLGKKQKAATESRIEAFNQAIEKLNQIEDFPVPNSEIANILQQLRNKKAVSRSPAIIPNLFKTRWVKEIDLFLNPLLKPLTIKPTNPSKTTKADNKNEQGSFEDFMKEYEKAVKKIEEQLKKYANYLSLTITQIGELEGWFTKTIKSDYAKEYLRLNEKSPMMEQFSLVYHDLISLLPKQARVKLENLVKENDIKILEKYEIAANRVERQLKNYQQVIERFHLEGKIHKQRCEELSNGFAELLQSPQEQAYLAQEENKSIRERVINGMKEVKKIVSQEEQQRLGALESQLAEKIAGNRINKQLDDYEKAKAKGISKGGYNLLENWFTHALRSTPLKAYLEQNKAVKERVLKVVEEIKAQKQNLTSFHAAFYRKSEKVSSACQSEPEHAPSRKSTMIK